MKKHYSPVDKLKHAISSLRKDVIVTQYCKEHRIPRSSLYNWRNQVSESIFKERNKKTKERNKKTKERNKKAKERNKKAKE